MGSNDVKPEVELYGVNFLLTQLKLVTFILIELK